MDGIQALKDDKDGILAAFVEELRGIARLKIPIRSDLARRQLGEVIPYFPFERQNELRRVLYAAFEQEQYLCAKQTVKALEDTCDQREQIFNEFLEKYDHRHFILL